MEKERLSGKGKLLFLAPLPPPITGMSVVSEKTREILATRFEIVSVNLSKNSFKQGLVTLSRLGDMFRVIVGILKARRDCEWAYLTVSQSPAGNAKDLLILALLKGKRIVLHLHGGGIKVLLFDRHPIMKRLNRAVCESVERCLVLGESLVDLYEGVMPLEKISILPNYADRGLFLSEGEIRVKFEALRPIKILYLSNLLPGKGYLELASALLSLESEYPELDIQANFIGGFESDGDRYAFLKLIQKSRIIHYLGVMDGEAKRQYLAESHIFCLPSYYRYMEGQPLSILEAYASGCAVVATKHGGIVDIFGPRNGLVVEGASAESLRAALASLCLDRGKCLEFALYNRRAAEERYSEGKYREKLLKNFSQYPAKIGVTNA